MLLNYTYTWAHFCRCLPACWRRGLSPLSPPYGRSSSLAADSWEPALLRCVWDAVYECRRFLAIFSSHSFTHIARQEGNVYRKIQGLVSPYSFRWMKILQYLYEYCTTITGKLPSRVFFVPHWYAAWSWNMWLKLLGIFWFDPSILRHRGIWGAAEEAVLN